MLLASGSPDIVKSFQVVVENQAVEENRVVVEIVLAVVETDHLAVTEKMVVVASSCCYLTVA